MVSGAQKKELMKQKRAAEREKAAKQQEKAKRATKHAERQTQTQQQQQTLLSDEDDEKDPLSLLPTLALNEDSNSLRTQFVNESKQEIERRRQLSRRPLNRQIHAKALDGHIDCFDLFTIQTESNSSTELMRLWRQSNCPIPLRPEWNYEMTKTQVQHNEEHYFQDYLHALHSDAETLSQFEHNLQVWRQLWRTIEASDIILYIVDVRWVLLQLNVRLIEYITETVKKPIVVVLNKIDLVPAIIVSQWQHWFQHHLPSIHVVLFSCKPCNLASADIDHLQRRRTQRKGALQLVEPEGGVQLRRSVECIVKEQCHNMDEALCQSFTMESDIKEAKLSGNQFTLSASQLASSVPQQSPLHSPLSKQSASEDDDVDKKTSVAAPLSRRQRFEAKKRAKQQRTAASKLHVDSNDECSFYISELQQSKSHQLDRKQQPASSSPDSDVESETETDEYVAYHHIMSVLNVDVEAPSDAAFSTSKSFVSVGCIGTPNAGKSSVLNSLFGRKLVSVSRTAGHTKHLQTIFINPTARLIDCPGLVFPLKFIRPAAQLVSGLLNIAQAREPYTSIAFVAEHLPVEIIFKLQPLLVDERSDELTGDEKDNDKQWAWSAYRITESFAFKKQFRTKKANQLDTHRAANFLLRQIVEGALQLYLVPPKQ